MEISIYTHCHDHLVHTSPRFHNNSDVRRHIHTHTHTDLCSLRSKWCRLYWLCNRRRLRVRLTRSPERMGWEHTNLWGNLQRPLGGEWNTSICRAQIYRQTHIRIHTHLSPPPTPIHTCLHTHRPELGPHTGCRSEET